MAKNYDTKSNTVGNTSQDTIYREPPPPREYGGGSSLNSNSSRPYDGGPTEQTPLFQQPQYTPTDDFDHHGGYKVPLKVLRDKSEMTICPHCNETVPSKIEFKNGCYTWLCCFVSCFRNNDYKDVDHICPKCSKVMITYSRKCSCC